MGMQIAWTGAQVTALRDALGLTQRRFAQKSGVGLSTVKKWRAEGDTVLNASSASIMDTLLARATPEQRERFTENINPASTDAVVAQWPPDMWTAEATVVAADLTREDLMIDRRMISRVLLGVVAGAPLLEPLERWLRSAPDTLKVPGRARPGIGMQEVEELRNAARVFRAWDDQHGGGLRRKAVVGQLAEVNELLTESHPPEIRRELAATMAQLAETAAMMSWDSGHQRLAQRYYALAVRAAREADDRAFAAVVLAGMVRQLLSLKQPADALELVRLAQDYAGGHLTPTTEAMLFTREAWAYGQLGRPTAFHSTCDRAHAAFADSDHSIDPDWIRYFDSAELAGTIGGRLLDIARRDGDRVTASEAAEYIGRAIESRRPGRRRSAALDQLGMVEARLIEGELEEACRIGHTALQVVEQTASDRVARKLARVYNRTGQFAMVGAVVELRERMWPLVAATA
ncbi:helix-turn-helix domain-containing protein [Nocardia sp. bgisy118]|uniref:helix-turn-helix domain-containing protein n=1 Tax=Nocardia sp. bgisy118 TaxID=3413786 RepID=UPI003F4A6C89